MHCIENGVTDLEKEYDYLIMAGGSDYRAYELLRKCLKYNVTSRKILFFDFEERKTDLAREDIKAYNEYKNLGFQTEPLKCYITDPSSCLKSLSESGIHFAKNDKIAIDISCFTKPYFFSILMYLKEQAKLSSITVFYTEPMSYIFSKGSYQSYHSTSGTLEVIEIPGYPGSDIGTTKKVLIILLGFDSELSSLICDEVSPDEIIIVNGFPAYSPKFKDISIINNERLLSNFGSPMSIKYAKANNPFETFNLLEDLKRSQPNSFFNIAPLGTKPMALGACLLAISYQSIRVVYPLPEKYTKKTTQKCYHSWAYTIPLTSE